MSISILYVYVYARGPCSVPFWYTIWIGVYYTMCGCVYTYRYGAILCDLLFFIFLLRIVVFINVCMYSIVGVTCIRIEMMIV